MKCHYCGEDGAYVGQLVVECPNRDCQFFSEEQLQLLIMASLDEVKAAAQPVSDETLSDPDVTPLMWQHGGLFGAAADKD